jgi:hypothetical protein
MDSPSEKVQLLEDDESELLDVENLRTRSPVPRKTYSLTIILHALLVLLYTVGSFLFVRTSSCKQTSSIYPLNGIDIRYKHQTYDNFLESPYSGPPSPEVDHAWHELLSSIAIRVSGDELHTSNQTSVELPEGGGYMAWIGVYHQLHCIKMLRQWNYREHYHPGLAPEDRPHWDIHADHCLDLLRSAAMCHGDTTLTTFGWFTKAKPMLNTRLIPHICVDWDALMESLKDRIVDRSEVQALVNPLLH